MYSKPSIKHHGGVQSVALQLSPTALPKSWSHSHLPLFKVYLLDIVQSFTVLSDNQFFRPETETLIILFFIFHVLAREMQ